MSQTVEVRFKGIRREFFLWGDENEPLQLKEAVVVEAERGHDLGRVHSNGETALKKCGGCTSCAVGGAESAGPAVEPVPAPEVALAPADAAAPAQPETPSPTTAFRSVLRRASQDEIRAANELRRAEEEARVKTLERVRYHSLDMKVSDAEWQFDRTKLTIYFTAEKRVDFRNLVRDLAGHFKTRIELRQIGVRDEAARLGGVGRCGRTYCCTSWLTDLSPVSLALAKDQHLSLNPSQISGGCGRLLCCLKYEHEFYVAARKRFPREGKMLQTARGEEKVVAVDIFRERVFLRGEQGSRIIPLVDLREEMAEAGPLTSEPGRTAEPSPRPPREPERSPGGPAGPGRREGGPPRPPRDGRRERPPRAEAAPPAAPAPPVAPATPAPDGQASPDGSRRRRRRRRGRRNRGGSPPPGGPAADPPSDA
jgi:cell fate regulator YaaT (PSP1 superfamily)